MSRLTLGPDEYIFSVSFLPASEHLENEMQVTIGPTGRSHRVRYGDVVPEVRAWWDIAQMATTQLKRTLTKQIHDLSSNKDTSCHSPNV